MSGYNAEFFKNEVLTKSLANNFDDALMEWQMVKSYEAEELQVCSCGYYPIRKIFILKNNINGMEFKLGRSCSLRFKELQNSQVYDSFETIQSNNEKPMGLAALAYCLERKWVSYAEKELYSHHVHKNFKHLSKKQQCQRLAVNDSVIKFMDLKTPEIKKELKSISEEDKFPLTYDTILYLFFKPCITEWEKDFLLNNQNTEFCYLTEAQKEKRQEINQQIIRRLTKIKVRDCIKKEDN